MSMSIPARVFLVAILIYSTLMIGVILGFVIQGSYAVHDQVRVECIVNRSNSAAHALCVKQGWDK